MAYQRQYYSGICKCRHTFDQHHTSAIVNPEYLIGRPPQMPTSRAEECRVGECKAGTLTYGVGPCQQYVDIEDPDGDAKWGTGNVVPWQ